MRSLLEPGQQRDLAEIAGRLYPDEEQLRAASAAGHEIGSHGHGHYTRGSLDVSGFEEELVRSKRRLEEILDREVAAFSHPYDAHRSGDRPLIARHFAQAATVGTAPILRGTDPLAIPRYNWPGEFRNGLRRRRWLWTGE
jgi:peptidoglycan/xylan/chitin deacetylase (PgdA/CDA1 family)